MDKNRQSTKATYEDDKKICTKLSVITAVSRKSSTMSVHTTLETVSASLHVAAEQVKKLQSISGPSDIVSAVKELTAPLQSIAKEIAQVKKDLESIKDNNLLCLQELKKQTAAAEKHVAVAERQAKLERFITSNYSE
jgi:cob(I)alamin adenosyltransferase